MVGTKCTGSQQQTSLERDYWHRESLASLISHSNKSEKAGQIICPAHDALIED